MLREIHLMSYKKSLEHLKNLKTTRVPYLGLELTYDHACHQKQNPSRETVPLESVKVHIRNYNCVQGERYLLSLPIACLLTVLCERNKKLEKKPVLLKRRLMRCWSG